jgi:MFS family permease
MNRSQTDQGGRSPVIIPNRQLHVGLFVVAQFLYAVTHYIYSPTLPLYTQSKTENLTLVGLTLSMYGLWQLVIRLPLGIVTDRVGRCKPFIVGGFALAAVGAWMMARAEGIAGLMLGRSLSGVAAGIFGLILVVFSGLFLPHESVQSSTILTAIGAMGIMSSTAMTGVLNELGGYALAFYVSAGAAVLALVVVLPAYERRRPPQPASSHAIAALITRRDVLIPSLLCAVLQYASTATTYGFLPILASEMGVRDVTQGILMSTQVGFLTLGSVVAGFTARRLGDWRTVWLGLALLAVGVGVAALAPALWLLFVAQCFIGFAWGITYPVVTGISIKYVSDVGRNTAMGAFQMGCSVGVFAGSWISGMVADLLGIRPMFGVTALAILALTVVVARSSGQRGFGEAVAG